MNPAVTFLLALSLGSTALAAAAPSSGSDGTICPSGIQCTIATLSTAAGVGVGIYALRQHYVQAQSIEALNTRIIQAAANQSANQLARLEATQIAGIVSEIGDGDRVTIQYRLSPTANQETVLSMVQVQAERHATDANRFRAAAVEALIERDLTRVVVDEAGIHQLTAGPGGQRMLTTVALTERPLPSMVQGYPFVMGADGQAIRTSSQLTGGEIESYRALMARASAEEAKLSELVTRVQAIKAGAPVTVLDDLTMTFQQESGNQAAVAKFLREEVASDSRNFVIKRLPAQSIRQIRSVLNKARGGAFLAVLLLGFAAEEATIGAAANRLDRMLDDGETWVPPHR